MIAQFYYNKLIYLYNKVKLIYNTTRGYYRKQERVEKVTALADSIESTFTTD